MPAASTLLMLAFEFPPHASVGAQRPVRFAEWLPQHGIRPVVVTTDAASSAAWFGPRFDDTVRLPKELIVHRVPCPRPPPARYRPMRRAQHFLSLGDDIGRRWAPQLAHVWDDLVAEAKPAALYATMPPFSVGPLALALARRSGLPLIIDFRDHWSQWCHNANPTWLHYRAKLRAERACLLGAHAVLGVTGQLVEDLQRVHPRVDSARFHVIPNGFDGDLAASGDRTATAGPPAPFVIGYVGSFYYSPEMRASVLDPWWRKAPRHWLQYAPRREDWLYRSPHFFFRALARLLGERPELRPQVRVRFAGDAQDWLQRQVVQFGLQDVVEHVGRLSHQACLEFEAGCDALLVTSMKVVGGRDYCVAGKTFEYLTSGRPILGIVTDGEQRDFLASSGIALVADADDVAASARAIERIVTRRFRPEPDRAFLQHFHRRETSQRLADVVRAVANHS